jgi:hypothetical protein
MQLCSTGFASGFNVTAFHSRFTALIVSRSCGECASPLHLGERNRTSTEPKSSKIVMISISSPRRFGVVSRERIAASPCSGLSPPPSTIPDKTPHRHPAGFPFYSTPPPACPDVPSVHLGSNLTLCPGFPFRALLVVYLMSGLSSGQESMGPPKFFDVSLPACHGLRTPADLHTLAKTGASYCLRAR